MNNNLFLFNDDGVLYVYEVAARGLKFIKRQEIIADGFDAWGPLAYADGMLIVRDAHIVKCIKII